MKISETSEYIIESEGEIRRLTFYLKEPQLERYFIGEDTTMYNTWQNEGLEEYLKRN